MVNTLDTSAEHNSRPNRKRKGHTDAHDYDLEELAQFFHLPINDVAVELGVCATVLKKICRKNGISRWPHRKIKSIDTMIEALESVSPSNPSEAEQIASDIQTLREKREFLMKNPNASYKSVVPKYAINAYNARLQKSGGIVKSTKRKKPRTIASATTRAQPYPTRYRGGKSVPTYYFEDEDAEVPSMGRNALITSQDEFAATQLLHLREMIPSPTKAPLLPSPTKVADMDISQQVPTQEDQSSFENFVSSLPKMRFKRCWEQQHTTPKLASDAPHFYFPNGHAMPAPGVRPQMPPQMVPTWGHALHKSPFGA